MSTPTEYRLLKERHDAFVAAVRELADELPIRRREWLERGLIDRSYGSAMLNISDDLSALLEGDSR